MKQKLIATLGLFSLIGSLFITSTFTARAADCNPVKPTGKTVGQIQVDSVNMPIKGFNYPVGGVMEPQRSTQMAALSLRHMPLSSTMGTSVILWHVNYSGCWNALNVLTSKSVGATFKVTDEKGKTRTYVISKRYVVKKGNYQTSWFDLIGPRKLLLATCTGDF